MRTCASTTDDMHTATTYAEVAKVMIAEGGSIEERHLMSLQLPTANPETNEALAWMATMGMMLAERRYYREEELAMPLSPARSETEMISCACCATLRVHVIVVQVKEMKRSVEAGGIKSHMNAKMKRHGMAAFRAIVAAIGDHA